MPKIWIVEGFCEDGRVYLVFDQNFRSWSHERSDATPFYSLQDAATHIAATRRLDWLFNARTRMIVEVIRCRKSWLYRFRSKADRAVFMELLDSPRRLLWCLFAQPAGRLGASVSGDPMRDCPGQRARGSLFLWPERINTDA